MDRTWPDVAVAGGRSGGIGGDTLAFAPR